jgi:hypothetical protein
MDVRSLALGLAANRILFGAGFVLSPEKAAKSWIGPVAASAGGGVMIRAASTAIAVAYLLRDTSSEPVGKNPSPPPPSMPPPIT